MISQGRCPTVTFSKDLISVLQKMTIVFTFRVRIEGMLIKMLKV